MIHSALSNDLQYSLKQRSTVQCEAVIHNAMLGNVQFEAMILSAMVSNDPQYWV